MVISVSQSHNLKSMSECKVFSCYQDTCLVFGHHQEVTAVVLTGQSPHSHHTRTTYFVCYFAVASSSSSDFPAQQGDRLQSSILWFKTFYPFFFLLTISNQHCSPSYLLKFVQRRVLWNFDKAGQHNSRTLTSQSWLIAGRNSRQEIFIRHYLHKAWTFCPGSWHLNTGSSVWLHLNNISPMMSTSYLLFNPQNVVEIWPQEHW